MSDDKKEAREQKHEEREEAREKRHEEREQARADRKGHHHHGDHFGHRMDRDEIKAHKELEEVNEEINDVTQKKDMHVHKAHHWIFKMNHAAYKILHAHEEELDAAKPESSWIPEALDAIFDGDKQAVALHKAIITAAGGHTAKDADFDKAGIPDLLKALQADVQKALQAVPDSE